MTWVSLFPSHSPWSQEFTHPLRQELLRSFPKGLWAAVITPADPDQRQFSTPENACFPQKHEHSLRIKVYFLIQYLLQNKGFCQVPDQNKAAPTLRLQLLEEKGTADKAIKSSLEAFWLRSPHLTCRKHIKLQVIIEWDELSSSQQGEPLLHFIGRWAFVHFYCGISFYIFEPFFKSICIL